MAIKMKEEAILNEWAMVLDHASGNVQVLLDDIQRRLLESKIPGGCTWDMRKVKSRGLFSKVKREFLLVRLREFNDYRVYIGIRDYGIHLDCCRFLTLEPGFFKKWFARKLFESEKALSQPNNILIAQDLRAWTTVVHHAVVDSVEGLMNKLGKNPNLLQRGSKGFLEIW